MTSIRVTCQCCGAVTLIRPAQLLLADDDWFSRRTVSVGPPLPG